MGHFPFKDLETSDKELVPQPIDGGALHAGTFTVRICHGSFRYPDCYCRTSV